MVFSSDIFIFFFLPITLIGYFLLRPVKWKNLWLLAVSLFFYYWGGTTFFPVLIGSILLNYIGGLLIEEMRVRGSTKLCKYVFVCVVLLNLLSLGYWKYTGFVVKSFGDLTGCAVVIPQIVLPIGISFFTFQGMSYVIDLYRKDVPVQKNIFKLGLYIALFPQLIAGPIVRYSDIERQLEHREHRIDDVAAGIRLFTIGLSKKAILANSAAVTADAIFGMRPYQNEPVVAWLGLLVYTIQLYFDFSGYSDMAVGLGRMFGFRFLQNFNYPFISRSASELWKRWHISLSSWFRDYVYIPLGGSRKGNVYLNLLCVFLLTGLWHGAAWNYVVWGLYWGLIVVAERFVSAHMKRKVTIPKVLSWMGTMFLWLMSMVIFRTDNLQMCGQYFQSLFGILTLRDVGFSFSYYINRYELFIIVVGMAAMMPFGRHFYGIMKERIPENCFLILENMFTLVLFGISVIYVVTGTYNPFIYFQF